MTGPILQLERLHKAYGGVRVTDHIDLDFEEGELHAIIGPNGAGKTTLIHQISGLLRSDGGKVLYRGSDITKLPMDLRAARGIVRSFQIVSVLPGFSVLENVAIAAQAVAGTSLRFFAPVARDHALNEQASKILQLVGLDHRTGDAAGAISHGEKRRLELAIALAAKPKILLLDEPLAGSGPSEAVAIVSLLKRIKGSKTIILVEHDMSAVFALADRISVLVYGKLIATGTAAEVRHNAEVRKAYLGEGEH